MHDRYRGENDCGFIDVDVDEGKGSCRPDVDGDINWIDMSMALK